MTHFRRQLAGYRGALAIGAAAGGCADGATALDLDGFSPSLCTGDVIRLFAGTAPPAPYDSVSAYERVQAARVVSTVGEPCKAARDPETCLVNVDQAHQGARSLVTTRGASVETLAGEEAIAAYLGAITSVEEDTLRAWASGLHFECGDVSQGGFRVVVDGGWDVVGTELTSDCTPVQRDRVVLRIGADGSAVEVGREVASIDPNACIGRLPSRLVPERPRPGGHPGAILARMARLEGAAVPAFVQLASDLQHHRAPVTLVRAAIRAAGDEVRHARAIGRLAIAYGERPTAVAVLPVGQRSLLEVAIENAQEGCARETLGALVGHVHAASAGDLRFAADMRVIAREETSHAALSWALDDWARTRLSSTGRRLLTDARRAAVGQLAGSVGEAYESATPEARRALGLPTPKALFPPGASGRAEPRRSCQRR